MILDTEEQQLLNQKKIRKDCETTVFHFFEFALHTMTNFYPDAELILKDKETSKEERINLEESTRKQIETCKTWMGKVFDQALELSEGKEYDEAPIEPIRFIEKVSHRILLDLLKILSERSRISNDSLVFLGEVGTALEIDPKTIDISIEQAQYERRKLFTEQLKRILSEEQTQERR